MCRKISTPFLLVCLILLISCAKNIDSVRTLVEYEESIKIASDTERTYVIRPGDILAINVWKEPELSKDVAVRLDGKVSLPLINDINATGLTCMQFQNHLRLWKLRYIYGLPYHPRSQRPDYVLLSSIFLKFQRKLVSYLYLDGMGIDVHQSLLLPSMLFNPFGNLSSSIDI